MNFVQREKGASDGNSRTGVVGHNIDRRIIACKELHGVKGRDVGWSWKCAIYSDMSRIAIQ